MQVIKYCASGNDFVIFHTFVKEDRSNLAKTLCNRFNGVGADGLIVLLPHNEYDFEWQFYNSDGSTAQMCGNGSRAVAHYAFFNNLVQKNSFSFLTQAGVISANVEDDMVETELTEPFEIKEPFYINDMRAWIVNTGVPHIVIMCDDLNLFDKELCRKLRFEYNANVNYVKKDGDILRVRTYERGVEDETQACGTGMAASFLFMLNQKQIGNESVVIPTSGEKLYLSKKDKKIFFKGLVKKIFSTEFML